MKKWCLICGNKFEEYSGGACGQEYEYDEGITIKLTEDQVEALREHFNVRCRELEGV